MKGINIRVSQSKSATPSTSTSQHWGFPEAHKPTWRSVGTMPGAAAALAMRAVKAERMDVNLILAFLCWLYSWMEWWRWGDCWWEWCLLVGQSGLLIEFLGFHVECCFAMMYWYTWGTLFTADLHRATGIEVWGSVTVFLAISWVLRVIVRIRGRNRDIPSQRSLKIRSR